MIDLVNCHKRKVEIEESVWWDGRKKAIEQIPSLDIPAKLPVIRTTQSWWSVKWVSLPGHEKLSPILGGLYSMKRSLPGLPICQKARGQAQHGGQPGWLDESDPAGVVLYLMYRPYHLPFLYRAGCPDQGLPVAICWNAQLLLYSKWTQPSVMSYVSQGRLGLVL